MAVTRMFDAVFVNQLFHTNARGETVFYPNGRAARGYLVPAARAAGARSGVRRLALTALIGVLVFVVLVPRAIEAWLGITLPLGWFIGGVVVATVIGVAAIVRALARLTVGLAPVSTRG
jgi:hypothetical protein